MVVENLLYQISISAACVTIVSIAIIAIWFHAIFKPDYRPGKPSMPFLWYQMTSGIHGHCRKGIAMDATYIRYTLDGMCSVLDRQKIFNLNILGRNYVFLFKADAIETILSNTKYIKKSQDYGPLKPMLMDGLLVSGGLKWHIRRKLLTPSFHFQILQDFVPLLQKQSDILVSQFLELSKEPWFNIYPVMKLCTLNIFLKTALGLDVHSENEETKTFFNAIEKFSEVTQFKITRPWIILDVLYNLIFPAANVNTYISIVHTFFRKLLAEKKNRFLASRKSTEIADDGLKEDEKQDHQVFGAKKRKAFMDLLLDLHFKDASFTEDDIIEETVSFFTGANVTLGITLSHIFYCLGLYKDEQKIVQNELDEIFGNSSRDIAEEDLRSMTYLECFIKETLRLYPLTYISREAPEGLKIYDYDVPKESIVVIFIHKLHRDPEVFPNPEKFDPSRFFPENCIGRSPYAFIPFSAGPRNCIAHRFAMITLKTLVASALRHFTIFSMDERDKIDGNSMPDEKNFGYSIRMKLKPRTVAA